MLGWLAASASLAEYNGKQIADYIYLPETVFDIDKFLSDISNLLERQTMVYAVVSEGLKNADGTPYFLAGKNTQDKFGHHQLGGLSTVLADAVKKNIVKRVKIVNPDIAQRCAAHMASGVDFEERIKRGICLLNLHLMEFRV